MAAARILDSPMLLVGPGRAGMALARSWVAAGGKLSGVVASTPRAAIRAGRALSAAGRVWPRVPPRCEILVLSVPDDRIARVAAEIAPLTRCRLAFHLSGALPASILAPLSRRGASIASLHPLRAFAGRPEESWRGAFVAVEGEADAVEAGEKLAAALGATGHRIRAKAKPLYHAAAALAAGGTAALVSIAARAAVRAGLPQRRAREALARLAAEAASAAADRPFSEAFTGPIARRDAETVRAHRAAAAGLDDFFELYRRLAREILETTPGRGRETEIRAILDGGEDFRARRPAPRKRRRGTGQRIAGATILRGFTRPKGA
jgi:predicted short-subunit dehydrogenase-like oxidoreductase (DUF2520 family)